MGHNPLPHQYIYSIVQLHRNPNFSSTNAKISLLSSSREALAFSMLVLDKTSSKVVTSSNESIMASSWFLGIMMCPSTSDSVMAT
mmetsp:Transcript_25157/g.37652  ORF Transcript_25157/g.37652 Transcript_25157/m.37652 type:complete len:85 (-) Transcript_25157:303-557(-)